MILEKYCQGNTPAHMVTIKGTEFYFSYKTCVAIRHKGKLYVSANIWGTTTGKHIMQVPGSPKRKDRMPREQFVAKEAEIKAELGL